MLRIDVKTITVIICTFDPTIYCKLVTISFSQMPENRDSRSKVKRKCFTFTKLAKVFVGYSYYINTCLFHPPCQKVPQCTTTLPHLSSLKPEPAASVRNNKNFPLNPHPSTSARNSIFVFFNKNRHQSHTYLACLDQSVS